MFMKKLFCVLCLALSAIIAASAQTEAYQIMKEYDISVSGSVDLGLSVKWAACNLGASVPEQPGFRFKWGEITPDGDTIPKKVCEWLTYKYYHFAGPFAKTDNNGLTKYNSCTEYGSVDNLSSLEESDDAAFCITDSLQRTPTQAEFREMIEKCNWELVVYKGTKGALITGPSGAQIFLPAIEPVDTLLLAGAYMTTDLAEDSRKSLSVTVRAKGNMIQVEDSVRLDRCMTFHIRPVQDFPPVDEYI